MDQLVPGFVSCVHRALTDDPDGGAQRGCIFTATLAAALGLGLRCGSRPSHRCYLSSLRSTQQLKLSHDNSYRIPPLERTPSRFPPDDPGR